MTEEEARAYTIELLGEKKGKLWWTIPNPHLGGLIPDNLVKLRRGYKVFQFIEAKKKSNDFHDKLVATSHGVRESGGTPEVKEFVLEGDMVHGLDKRGQRVISMPYLDYQALQRDTQ